MTKEELWQTVLSEMELKISPAHFATWFKDTCLSSMKNQEVEIAVPTNFAKEWFANKYHRSIFTIIKNSLPGLKKIDYITAKLSQSPSIFKKDISPISQNKNHPTVPGTAYGRGFGIRG